ncbi:hypothetical protein GCM10028808_32870 [Spirosoma migulaei]
MPYLSPYTPLLTNKTAAHLLRRATFGPTQSEIANFTGLTATQAVQQLINNANYSPPAPVDIDGTQPTVGQTYFDQPYNNDRNSDFSHYLRYWWLGLMTSQTAPPSLLDKLTLFWHNHFVITREIVEDCRFIKRYLLLLRNNALGNFRTLVTQITKDPAMLRFLNGNENETGKPNENYARELQELFTVGAVDFAGNKNYTEDDVKAAARVLTGWQYTNYEEYGTISFDTTFTLSRHDSTNKVFSEKYNNTVITGRSVNPSAMVTAGDAELDDLVTMLLNHPQTARFICRKLYRWYVNPNVTQAIEDNVIVPLAQFLSSPSNNYAIQPVIVTLLTSEIFFDDSNRGSMVKSPADLAVGTMRLFNQPVPDMAGEYAAFKTYFDFMFWRMRDMQMTLLDPPSVLGYEPYYQTGYSKTWINVTTLAIRSEFTDAFIWGGFHVSPVYILGINLLAWATSLQPNFDDLAGTPAITCLDVQKAFSTNMFATDLLPSQVDFLIDTIMMQELPRTSWTFEWNAYRALPNDVGKRTAVFSRLQNLMKYMLRMAEYQLF